MKSNKYVYASLLELGDNELKEANILQRRRLPKPNGKNHKLKFKNPTKSSILVRAVGYYSEPDSEQIFSYTEIEYNLEPEQTLVVSVEAKLVKQLYTVLNENK